MSQKVYLRPLTLAESPQGEAGEAVRLAGGLSYASRFAIITRDGVQVTSRRRVAASDMDAAIGDLIARLPQGLNTEVGERGLKLSGGEKQRVAIARTLIKNPPILLFDEATSALDTRTEPDILGTLRALAANRTTISIAHRLSTIVDSDTILVLDQGQLIEQGSHADLLRRDGLYADMWARQAAESGDDLLVAAQ